MERVLYESPPTARADLSGVVGAPELVSAFCTLFREEAYKNDPVTTFPEKRIVLKSMKNILVGGNEPVIHQLTEKDIAGFGTNALPLVAVLVQKWGYGFYHFINEILPKVLRVHKAYPKIPILIHYNDTFIKGALDYFGVKNPIIPYNNGVSVFPIKNAIHITDTASGNPTPSDIDIIRAALPPHLVIEEERVNILIYRKEALRNIANFDAMHAALEAEFPGEKWVVFNSLPFAGAVALFTRAKRIVGAHGAGLSNMIFAPKGTPIYELFPHDMVNVCYWHLSWILGNPHKILVCESGGPPLRQLTVPIDQLKAHVGSEGQ